MAKKCFRVIFLVMITVLMILLTGCVTNVGIPNVSRWSKEVTSIGKENYTVLGPVKLEKSLINVIGLFGRGGVLYSDLLLEAQRCYNGSDAVIYVNVESKVSNYFFLYTKIEYTLTGIAIRFDSSQRPLINTSSTQSTSSSNTINNNLQNTLEWKCPNINCGVINSASLNNCRRCNRLKN